MIGRVISGRYVVEAVVGTGGMAVVYRAYDKIRKQTVAIKVLRPEYGSDREFVRRFSREAEAASKVSHENIVNMLDVGQDGEIRYIVMEFVDGQTLKEMIRAQGRINPDVALRMTIRILAAVDHAHRNGIIHRDIKPQNIMVDRHGRVKVADFGIARLKASQTTRIDGDGSALGSVHYFSPEQARGEVADEKSDLYSVGVCMYEMLTGRVPFDGENSISVALKHVQEEPKSMRLCQDGISKAMDEVVMRALCKDKTKRYQSAAEMAADLRKTITHPKGGFVKYAQEEAAAEKTDRKRKRHWREHYRRRVFRAALLGALTVIAVVMIVLICVGAYGRTSMPNVIGQQQYVAIDMLDESGLYALIESSYSEEFDVGVVIGQSADAGDRLYRGATVTLTVSAGTKWFYMDNFLGDTEEDARSALDAAGAKNVTVEYVQNSAIEPGIVISQSLEPGYQSRDEAVTITVSGQSVIAPTLTGLTLEGATALLEAEGLKVGNVTEGYSADSVANTIIAQGVAPGAQVLKGTAVDLTVSRHGEVSYAPASKFSVVVPIDGLEVEIHITAPSGQETLVSEGTMAAGTYLIELSSAECGMHTICTYLDGVPMDETEVWFE